MKVIVDGEPEEIKNLLNAIGGSKEQSAKINLSYLNGHLLKNASRQYQREC